MGPKCHHWMGKTVYENKHKDSAKCKRYQNEE
jgi:hypothetical protein